MYMEPVHARQCRFAKNKIALYVYQTGALNGALFTRSTTVVDRRGWRTLAIKKI